MVSLSAREHRILSLRRIPDRVLELAVIAALELLFAEVIVLHFGIVRL